MAKVAAVLETDDTRGRPLAHAPHSGYARLERGAAVILVDVGRPPAPGLNSHAASAPLAFEFSDGHAPDHRQLRRAGLCRHRLGRRLPDDGGGQHGGDRRRVERPDFFRPAGRGDVRHADPYRAARFRAEVGLSPEGSFLEACHDGYATAFGVAMRGGCSWRRMAAIFAARTGLSPKGRAPISIFVLCLAIPPSPGVKAIASKDGASIMLQLPNKAGWTFTVRGGVLRLEDSVYLPGRVQPRRSQQIVVRGRGRSAPAASTGHSSGSPGKGHRATPDRPAWPSRRCSSRPMMTGGPSGAGAESRLQEKQICDTEQAQQRACPEQQCFHAEGDQQKRKYDAGDEVCQISTVPLQRLGPACGDHQAVPCAVYSLTRSEKWPEPIYMIASIRTDNTILLQSENRKMLKPLIAAPTTKLRLVKYVFQPIA